MHLAKVYSAELEGIKAKLIEVEVDLNSGLHSFTIVGLADKALSEAKERVNSAIKNGGFKPPTRENRKITVNLAPADIKKTGSQYDVAIALGYLLATKQIKEFDPSNKLFLGELALNGDLRPIAGALNFALLAQETKKNEIYLPEANVGEAGLVQGVKIFGVKSLFELINHLAGLQNLPPQPATFFHLTEKDEFEIDHIKGQEAAKRALTIAAAGGHNILMSGPPGSGKTILAKALISILPQLSLEESLEVSAIWSAAGLLKGAYLETRPFRSPHQTASPIAIVGGGPNPKPGEISLAHRGVLFLDELPEFRRDLLEALRQPLEAGEITISRIKGNLTYPARFILVAAMNPCPCGYYGDPEKECRCTAYEVLRYQRKISGPLLDRIDIQINVPRAKFENLQGEEKVKKGKAIKNLIEQARKIQQARFRKHNLTILTNAEMSSKDCDKLIELSREANELLKEVFEKALLSTRGYYRLLKTARTIADLEENEKVEARHIAEAFQLRVREK